VTWPLASGAIVVAVLAAGLGWYEVARPSSKLVALVAALASAAVAGRVAFAAIPNVQATTDIVLISGYALGAGPGFAVGAVAALASNFFLGQGPWTPWQMLGWGGVGLVGAVLARFVPPRAYVGRMTRAAFACCCALAGLAFGAWMDLFTLTTFSPRHSLYAYLAISAVSLPFNVAHAIGNALVYVAFGPALIRLLLRFRRRFEIEWRPPVPGRALRPRLPGALPLAIALFLATLAAGVTPGAAPASGRAGAAKALHYLERAQNRDGGFGAGPGERSSDLVTGWAVLGLEAGGRNPLDVHEHGRTPIDFLRSRLGSLSDTGDIERAALALSGAGRSERRLVARRLVSRLLDHVHRDGSLEDQVNLTAFGILALRASGQRPSSAVIERAAGWLGLQQNADGGFAFSKRGGASDVDDTGAVLQALRVARVRRARLTGRAIAYLRRARNADGGLGQLLGSRSNSQSTAWAIQGLVAARRDPGRFPSRRARSPLTYLRSLQQSDGSFRYSRTSAQTPVWVTAQAIAALELETFPLRSPPRRAVRRTDGGGTARAGSAPGGAARPAGGASARGARAAARRAATTGTPDRRRRSAGALPAANVRADRDGDRPSRVAVLLASAAVLLAGGAGLAMRVVRRRRAPR
jgi:energy-coupling factor transport system substrate-specific component